MLFLVFSLGADRYVIEAAQVVEVLPLVNSKQIPRAPPGIAGLLDYHGKSVPLIDLTELALGRPSQKWLSTRIILVHYRTKSGKAHPLGFLAERVTGTMHCSEEDFADSGIAVADAPYLGTVLTDAAGIIQRVEIQNLLTVGLGNYLFREPTESQ